MKTFIELAESKKEDDVKQKVLDMWSSNADVDVIIRTIYRNFNKSITTDYVKRVVKEAGKKGWQEI